MKFCGPNYCGTLTLKDGHYDAVYQGNANTSIYTVERFTPELVALRRADSTGAMAVLTGKISAAGNSIVDGSITFTSGGGTYPFTMTW
jgi:hypothetical protein